MELEKKYIYQVYVNGSFSKGKCQVFLGNSFDCR